MNELIDLLDKDIKICEDTLKANDFLEMVIIIEELHNKYKNDIEKISEIEKDVVWKYNKNDLQIIEDSLKEYKVKTIKEEDEKNINKRIKNFREKIENSEISNKEEILNKLESIESIKNEDIVLDEKWDKLRSCLTFIQNQNRHIAIGFLEILEFIIIN
ncbi:hypothetical protein [[Clostridium] dakarense]|uniref:hypothetical protein n=1 Tax=Faecalimicrobium dakarense TaxID=1301100 RepID=UPI0004AE367A|nr:hypothetical protein [[Clostridium] dakarense]